MLSGGLPGRLARPERGQVDPRLIKAGVGIGLVMAVFAWFANWVIASERRSFSDRPAAAVPAPEHVTEDLDPDATLRAAQDALQNAFVAARAASREGRTFLDAGPARLTELEPGYSYVDGPSTMPRIVSVASSEEAWAAAVMASDGTCLWIRATTSGEVTRTTGEECTGSAALASHGRG